MKNKLISIVTPCYNEEGNVEDVYKEVKNVFKSIEGYIYEHIFIDNSSKDNTVSILKDIARSDKNVKVIINTRNFGHIRSPYYAKLQASGDAMIGMVADLQDPPSLIKDFIKKWEEGHKVVLGVKKGSEENFLMFNLRKLFYRLLNKISEVELVENYSGYGLYDRQVMEILKKIDDPYPYLRGLIAEIGFDIATIEYVQLRRQRGKTKNNFYTLYDMAMLGLVNYSKLPLRLATMLGFISALLSFLAAVFYFLYKIIYWKNFSVGIAPLVIGLFFFSSIQLFFLGIAGEYVGALYTRALNRPLVIEKERINF
jgi:glycosyltransferase involved in cell wall biosynthesis